MGSTTLVVGVDNQGNTEVIHRECYKPYGEVAYEYKLWHQGQEHRNIPTTFGYTGQRLDKEESGLMYYGARYYDPALSYFVSADPTMSDRTKSGDLNRYLYVRGNPLRYIDTSGWGPEDHYVFANGCVGPTTLFGCPKSGPDDWGDYYALLRDMYNYEGWGNVEDSNGRVRHVSFKTWSASHVHFISAGFDLSSAAKEINDKLHDIKGNGSIHFIGTSQGGAAILQYFADAMHGKYQIDRRIASFTTVEGNLDAVANIEPPSEPPWPHTMGDWLSQHTRIRTGHGRNSDTALNVDSPKDTVRGCVPGIECEHDPTYPSGIVEPPGAKNYHDFTGSHMANETRIFLERVWR